MERSNFLAWHEDSTPEWVGAIYESYAADMEAVTVANAVGHDLRSRVVHPSIRVWTDYATSAERACSDVEWSSTMREYCLTWHDQPCNGSNCP